MLEVLFAQVLPQIAKRRRQAIARTCMYMVSGLTSMALAGPPELVESTLRETKIAVESYLAAVLESG